MDKDLIIQQETRAMTKAWKFPIVLSGLVAFTSLVLALYCVYGKIKYIELIDFLVFVNVKFDKDSHHFSKAFLLFFPAW